MRPEGWKRKLAGLCITCGGPRSQRAEWFCGPCNKKRRVEQASREWKGARNLHYREPQKDPIAKACDSCGRWCEADQYNWLDKSQRYSRICKSCYGRRFGPAGKTTAEERRAATAQVESRFSGIDLTIV